MTPTPVDIDIEWFWHLGGTEKCFRYVATFADGSRQQLGTQSHDWPEGWAAIERETWWKRCAAEKAKRDAILALIIDDPNVSPDFRASLSDAVSDRASMAGEREHV